MIRNYALGVDFQGIWRPLGEPAMVWPDLGSCLADGAKLAQRWEEWGIPLSLAVVAEVSPDEWEMLVWLA